MKSRQGYSRTQPLDNAEGKRGVQGMEGSPRHKDEAALSTDHGLEPQLLNLLEKLLKVY